MPTNLADDVGGGTILNLNPNLPPDFSVNAQPDSNILGFITEARPDFKDYYYGTLVNNRGYENSESGLLRWARTHLGAGHDIGAFNTYLTNKLLPAPPGPGAGFVENPPDNNGGGFNEAGLLASISALLTGLLGAVQPNNTAVDASVTQNVDNRVTDNSVTNYTTTGISEDVFTSTINGLGSMFDNFFNRLPDLLSVPRGGDASSPMVVPLGYAPNLDQSSQRSGNQVVATVQGLGSPGGGVMGTGIPWATLLTVALVAGGGYFLYRKFFRRG